jgi:hypothetical protein
MPLSTKSAGLMRALIYPIQFDTDPLDGVDRVMDMVVKRRALNATPAEYRAGIQEALTADDRLSELIPDSHPEEVIRKYLTEVARRIERLTSSDATSG